MATSKTLKTRVAMKHDTEANWLKAGNFIPLKGEIVIYDNDSTHSYYRVKIGNGTTAVNSLDFVSVPITNAEIDTVCG